MTSSSRPGARTTDPPPESGRVHPRAPAELDVTLENESNFWAGFTENICEGGIFVATHVLRPIGTRLELAVTLPSRKEPLRITGTVRWVRQYSETSDVPPGMGLRFEELEADAQTAIREYTSQRDPIFFDDEEDEKPSD